jgi:hypothetical protein
MKKKNLKDCNLDLDKIDKAEELLSPPPDGD